MSRMHEYRVPKRLCILILGIITLAALVLPQNAAAVRRGSRISAGIDVSLRDYDYLSDYGEWINLPRYGIVWRPYVVEDWGPFYHGHWSWTYDGWAWISYEPFGWLVYHYGYWYHRPHIGWFWVPGRVWSPARVQWYTWGGYCGWAPMPPPNAYWPDPWDRYDVNIWIVVNLNHFADEHVGHHRIDPPFGGGYYGDDRGGRDERGGPYESRGRDIVQRGGVVKQPPSIRDVERVTNRRIPMVKANKERVTMLPSEPRAPMRTSKTPGGTVKKLVTPARDVDRVKQNAPAVEREVLAPKKSAPREQQRATEQKSRETQRENQQKQKTRRR